MNEPSHKAALGANPDRAFEACSSQVNRAFMMQGDGVHNAAALLPELVDHGVRLLVYAGNAGQYRLSMATCTSLTPISQT
jgi:cathepsin A (carboxypeptidase C)